MREVGEKKSSFSGSNYGIHIKVNDEISTALLFSQKVLLDHDMLTTFINFSDADISLVDGGNENVTSP